MKALAPLPGRQSPTAADEAHLPESTVDITDSRATGAPWDPSDPTETRAVSVGAFDAEGGTVDLTFHRPRSPSNTAGQASWVLGLALSLLSEGAAERVIMAEVLAEAAGRSQALEGAYGRAVALLSEHPGDPLVLRAVDLLAKALLRSRRPARAAEEV